MFYSRRDPKLILDRKQGSRRHSFSGFAGTASLNLIVNHSYISYAKSKDRIVRSSSDLDKWVVQQQFSFMTVLS